MSSGRRAAGACAARCGSRGGRTPDAPRGRVHRRAQAKQGVGGGADVRVVDEADRRFVAQLRADVRPLTEDGHEHDERQSCGNREERVRSGHAVGRGKRRQRGYADRDRCRDGVDHQLPGFVRHVKRGERDPVAGHRPARIAAAATRGSSAQRMMRARRGGALADPIRLPSTGSSHRR